MKYSTHLPLVLAAVIAAVRTADAASLTWSGAANESWDLSTLNWAGPAVYQQGDSVLFDDTGSAHTIQLSTMLAPSNVVVNANVDYTFAGAGNLAGTTGLTKQGTGTLTLNETGPDTFSGNIAVNAGTLAVNSTILGSHALTVAAGATLSGSGILAFPVTIQAGGTLSPAAGNIGTLTISNELTLAGNCMVQIDRGNNPNSDRVAGIGTVHYGGTLSITRSGPSLQPGDCFALFGADYYGGTFATLDLPALDSGLQWDTSMLQQDGSLCVVGTPPTIVQSPTDLTVNEGDPAMFTVIATGAGPLTYQWNYYGEPIPGETGVSLTMASANLTNEGVYSVTVSNSLAGAVSGTATLVVLPVQSVAGPILVCPTNATFYTSCSGGVPVAYTVMVTNVSGTNFQVVCSPPPGSIFKPGTTLVNCYVYDSNLVTNSGSFTVTIVPSPPSTNDIGQLSVFAPGPEGATNNVGLDRNLYHWIARTNIVEWTLDRDGLLVGNAQLQLSSVPAPGLLFGDNSQDDTTFEIVPGQSNRWDITLRQNTHTEAAGDTPSVALPDEPFDLLYVPLSAPGLVGGLVHSDTGIVEPRAGDFTIVRTNTGEYRLTLPGKNPGAGHLMLNPAGPGGFDSNGLPRGVLIAYHREGEELLISTRVAVAGSYDLDTNAPLCDVNFSFAWVDFIDPTARTNPFSAQPSALTAIIGASNTIELSWADTAAGFQVERATSLFAPNWSAVTNPAPVHDGTVFRQSLFKTANTEFFRLAGKKESTYCNNGDFEQGDFSGWTLYYGLVKSPIHFDWGKWLSGTFGQSHLILPDASWSQSGYDPIVSVIPTADEGAHTARLGDRKLANHYKARMDYNFTVNSLNENFVFHYAAVVEKHFLASPAQQARVSYRIFPTGTDYHWTTIAGKEGPANDPYYTQWSDETFYHNWACEYNFLGDYPGQSLTISFMAKDCRDGGHKAWAYVDALCQPADEVVVPEFTLASTVCQSDAIVADMSATTGATAFIWYIEESTSGGGRVSGTGRFKFFSPPPSGTINLKTIYNFECNKYYHVSLVCWNSCGLAKEKTRLVHVICPDVDAGPDRTVCSDASATHSFQIGTPAKPGYTYTWTPSTGLNNSHLAQPTATIVDPRATCEVATKYVVTAQDATGCTASDAMTIHLAYPPAVSIHDNGRLSECDRIHTLTAANLCNGPSFPPNTKFPPGTTFVWSSGETTPAIQIQALPLASVSRSVTVTTSCGSTTANIIVPPDTLPFGSIDPSRYWHPNVIKYSSPIYANSHFRVYDTYYPLPYANVYNATWYEFEVYDRWGSLLVHLSKSSSTGFDNGTIPEWDGRVTHSVEYPSYQFRRTSLNEGDLLPAGAYEMIMYLRNCENDNSWFHHRTMIFSGSLAIFN